MIPNFPKFEKLTLAHFDYLRKLTDKYPPYADFNFTCLWSYNIFEEILVSNLNHNLVVKANDYLTHKIFFSFYGKNKFIETSDILLNYCVKNKIEPKLKLIPGIFVEKYLKNNTKLLIKEDRDNFDYVFSLEEMTRIEGNKYRKKRQLYRKFIDKYSKHETRSLRLSDKQTQDNIFKLFHKWKNVKKKKDHEVESELKALTKLIKEASFIKYITTGLFVDNQLVAFIINEKLSNEYSIGHFTKTNHEYTGVVESLYKYFAFDLLKQGCKYWNAECDMGFEGLRNSKMSWRPKFFLKKYDISLL
jgi:hypothetical protein